MTGLAQKGGAVLSHVRIARSPEDIHAVRLASGGAKLLLGCDIVVAAAPDAISKIAPGETTAVVNTHETIVADFTRDPDLPFPEPELERTIAERAGHNHTSFVEGTRLATALLGDSIATNMFMLGFAWQMGTIPIGLDAIEEAIALNGVAVDANKRAFLWGRRAAHDQAAVEKAAAPTAPPAPALATALEDIVAKRIAFLTGYQDEAYARRYKDLVVRVQTAEAKALRDNDALARAVARNYFKLLAYKDEYEVARLFTESGFVDRVAAQFEGDYKLNFHLAPPLLAERDLETGIAKKKAYGSWMLRAFRLLAKLRFLRGGRFDPFGRTAERKRERQLISEYETTVDELLNGLNAENHAIAVEIASLPERIRGYGHIKERNIEEAKSREADLRAAFRDPAARVDAAD
jgi:indolepyruvate ferredoxin oxidoreductase